MLVVADLPPATPLDHAPRPAAGLATSDDPDWYGRDDGGVWGSLVAGIWYCNKPFTTDHSCEL